MGKTAKAESLAICTDFWSPADFTANLHFLDKLSRGTLGD
jgi:hypothetical protein